jgi:hypothetical protein
MSAGRTLLMLGGFGLLLSGLVFWQDPLMDFRIRHPEFTDRLVLLYGFPWVVGILLLALRLDLFILELGWITWFLGVFSFLGLPWFVLWCLIWSKVVSPGDGQALVLACGLGIGTALGLGLAGWLAAETLKRRVWFLRGLGWVVFYESVLNLFLQPGLWVLTFSALGGALILLATFAPRRMPDGL